MTKAQARRARDRRLHRAYGLTQAQWVLMFRRQGGRCAICLEPGRRGKSSGTRRRLYVDHDHKGTKRVRGLLDYRCNHRLLGRGLEDPGLHRRAAAYLESEFDGRKL